MLSLTVVRVSPTQQTSVRGCVSEATVYIYDLNAWEVKAEGSGVQGIFSFILVQGPSCAV